MTISNTEIHQIDVRRLRVVIEVARAGAISRAATSLCITQSAVSRCVSEVEEALGVQLFERLPRGTRLTNAGEGFVARALRVVAALEDLISETHERPDRVEGRLRIGMASSGYAAGPQLAHFAREYHAVAIETVAEPAQSLGPKLIRGELDLIIGSESQLDRWPEVEVTELATLSLVFLVREGHPLTRADRPTEAEVLRHPMILPENFDPAYSPFPMRYVENGLPPTRPRYVTNDATLARLLLAETDAVLPLAVLPQLVTKEMRQPTDGLVVIRDAVSYPQQHLSLARCKGRPKTTALAVLEEFLIQAPWAPNSGISRTGKTKR